MGMTSATADLAVAAGKHLLKKGLPKASKTVGKTTAKQTKRAVTKAAPSLSAFDQFESEGIFKGVPEQEIRATRTILDNPKTTPEDIELLKGNLKAIDDPDEYISNKAAAGIGEMLHGNQIGFDENNIKIDRQLKQYSEINGHKQQLPEEAAKTKLDYFISENQVDLSTAPKGRMMTIEGMQDVPMNPNTKEELLPKIQQYIDLQNNVSPKKSKTSWRMGCKRIRNLWYNR